MRETREQGRRHSIVTLFRSSVTRNSNQVTPSHIRVTRVRTRSVSCSYRFIQPMDDDGDGNPRPHKRARLHTPPMSSPLSSCPGSQATLTTAITADVKLPISSPPTSSNTAFIPPTAHEEHTLSVPMDCPRALEHDLVPLPPAHLLLSLPSLLLHPPSHALHPRSLHLSLLALRRCLALTEVVGTPDMECRAWTGLAEVGMQVVGGGFSSGGEGWAKGVEVEVEKAIGKGVRHPLYP